jgi:hypothetical protein
MWFPSGGLGKITVRDRDWVLQKHNHDAELPEGPHIIDAELLALEERELVEFADPRDDVADGPYSASSCQER